MTRQYRIAAFLLLFSVILLSAFGIIMLYSVTADMVGERYLKQQFKWLFLGLTAAGIVYLIDYRRLARHSLWLLAIIALPLAYLAGLFILGRVGVPHPLLAKMPFVPGAINGTFRWLEVGGVRLQPSELAKLAIVVFLAHYYGTDPRAVESFRRGLWHPMLFVGPVVLGILLGGSFSVTVITGSMIMGLFFIVGIRLRYLLLPVIGGCAILLAALLLSPERWTRLTTFTDPEQYAEGAGYQLWQSQKALGSGGWFGVGPNQSRMKQFYLPEAHTDFILSIAGEELGFAAIVAVVVCYLALVGAAFLIGQLACDRVGMFMAFGIGLSLGLHAFVNLGVVSGFLPTTGVTAPLISYGGSSLVVTWLDIGFLLNILRVSQEQAVALLGTDPAQRHDLLVRNPAA